MSFGPPPRDDRSRCPGPSGPHGLMNQFRPFTAFASTSQSRTTYSQNNVDYLKNVAQHDPFCRACKEFNEWVNKQQTQRAPTTNPGARGLAAQHGCPLDREELGRSSWGLLHSMAGYYPDAPTAEQQKEMREFIGLFGKYFPCRHCSEDFMRLIRTNPPDTTSRHRFSQWLCQTHNTVNAKLGKPQFDCSIVDKRWRDGWPDGSCD